MVADDLAKRISAASRTCEIAITRHAHRSPKQAFAELAQACDELGIDEWDTYGESGPVAQLEAEVTALFGVGAVAFFPSGIMAQQVALHFDAARIWESQPWFGHSLSEIAALADSLYVSSYKGLGGLAGAALLGPADFIAEARLWRRRQGGTIYHTTAEAVSALVGLRDQLPRITAAVTWARAFAAELPAYVTVQPEVPHTNQFLVYAAGTADAANQRVLSLIEEHRIGMPAWAPAEEPGRVRTEIAVSAAALELDPAKMAALFSRTVDPILADEPEGNSPASPIRRVS